VDRAPVQPPEIDWGYFCDYRVSKAARLKALPRALLIHPQILIEMSNASYKALHDAAHSLHTKGEADGLT
jgi:hypothetical protein